MEFLTENDTMIIRNIHDPEWFVPDSFEAVSMSTGIMFIVGKPRNPDLIQAMINPDKLMVQAVHFRKIDWTVELALDWLKENQKNFETEKAARTYAAELKSIKGVEIFSAGVWNGDEYTTKDLDEMVRAFDETQNEIRPFLKLGHNNKQKLLEEDGLPAAGWIGKLYRKGEKLVADFIDIPNKIFEMIDNKSYRNVSSEIYLDVQIKDKNFKYMLGAVALLGAQTPGVMNLSDILARFGLKDYHSIKSYADNENDVKIINYNLDNETNKKEGIKMPKTEIELALELELKAAQEKNKQFETDLEAKDSQVKELEAAKADSDKKVFEAEQKTKQVEIEKQIDTLVNEKLISTSMRPYALALLQNEVNAETKKYDFKVEEKEVSLERFELLKEFATLSKTVADVNFDENSSEGTKENEQEEDAVAKFASDNEITYAEAYRQYNAGKLTITDAKPHVTNN